MVGEFTIQISGNIFVPQDVLMLIAVSNAVRARQKIDIAKKNRAEHKACMRRKAGASEPKVMPDLPGASEFVQAVTADQAQAVTAEQDVAEEPFF